MAVTSDIMRDMDFGLADYEFAFGLLQDKRNDNGGQTGFIFNRVPNYIEVTKVTGLYDMAVEVSDRKQLLQHGDVVGIHLAQSKTFEVTVDIRKAGRSESAYRADITDFESAISPDDRFQLKQFNWKLPGENERFVRCIPYRRRRIIDPMAELGVTRIQVQFQASDPRSYDAFVTQIGAGSPVVVTESLAYPEIAFSASGFAGLTNVTSGRSILIYPGGFTSTGYVNMDRLVRAETGLIVYDHLGVEKYGSWDFPRYPLYLQSGTNVLTLDYGSDVSLYYHKTYL